MKDKLSILREHLLDGIESGRFPVGGKLPGARELAVESGTSFLLAQHAVSSLEQDGVIECVARRGAYVRPDWHNRLIRNHMVIFNDRLPWLDKFRELQLRTLPELRLCRGFKRGMFELRTTLELQQNRDQYMDLSPFLPEPLSENSRFFSAPFKGFSEPDGRLFGIPFIFSPRVVIYHKPMLAKANLKEPDPFWSWDDFIDYVKKLTQTYPAEQAFNYSCQPYFWLNFVFRAGGKLFERRPDGSCAIHIDAPATMHALELLRQLRRAFGKVDNYNPFFGASMAEGKLAMAVSEREFCYHLRRAGFNDWGTVPLPRIPGGCDAMAQATDLICVRKECADNKLAAKFIRVMLSETVQEFIGTERYGIPISKPQAMASIDPEDPRDMLFLSQMNHMSTEYNIDSVAFAEIITGELARIIAGDMPLEPETRKLASAIRTVTEIRNRLRQS